MSRVKYVSGALCLALTIAALAACGDSGSNDQPGGGGAADDAPLIGYLFH